MKPIGTPGDAIRPNEFFLEAIVDSATGSKKAIEVRQGAKRSGLQAAIRKETIPISLSVATGIYPESDRPIANFENLLLRLTFPQLQWATLASSE